MDVDDLPHSFPSFFKIILEPRHDLCKLAIPKKFMTDHGSDLLDVVSLKIPTGKTWEVELLKENDRAWFNDGWPEVVNFCSICHGHFLMFTYEGKSQFNLYIFDMTACEIEYPLDRDETREVRKRGRKSKTNINSTAPVSSSQDLEQPPFVKNDPDSLTKLFGFDPEQRKFRNLIFPPKKESSPPLPEEEEKEEIGENMSSGTAKPHMTLDMVMAARQKQKAASRTASKRKAGSTSTGPTASKRRRNPTPPPVTTPAKSDSPVVDLSDPQYDPAPKPTREAPAEVTLKFPGDFGKSRSSGDLTLLDQMLLPGPRSVLEKKPLGELADHAAERAFESLQMVLLLRGNVSQLEDDVLSLQSENGKLRVQVNKAQEERSMVQKELGSVRGLLAEETDRKRKLEEDLVKAEGTLAQVLDAKSSLFSEVQLLKGKNTELKKALQDSLAYATQVTKVKYMKQFHEGKHVNWDLAAEEKTLAEDFPGGLNLDLLSDLEADDLEESVDSPAADQGVVEQEAAEEEVAEQEAAQEDAAEAGPENVPFAATLAP